MKRLQSGERAYLGPYTVPFQNTKGRAVLFVAMFYVDIYGSNPCPISCKRQRSIAYVGRIVVNLASPNTNNGGTYPQTTHNTSFPTTY